MTPADVTDSSVEITIKEVGASVEVSTKAFLTSQLDLLDSYSKRLGSAFAEKVDGDIVSEWEGTTNVVGDGTAPISNTLVADAFELVSDEYDKIQAIVIHPHHVSQIMKDSNFVDAGKFGDAIMIKGVKAIGMLYGIPVIVSKKAKVVTGNYSAYIVKNNSVAFAYKKELDIEMDKDILKRSYVLAGTMYYGLKGMTENVVKILTN